MKVLVTGGAGFIGSHLVHRLVQEQYEVQVLDNFSTGTQDNLKEETGRINLITGDVREYSAVKKAVKGVEVIFHQAALCSVERSVNDPRTSNEVNVGGTMNILTAARDEGIKRVIFASSSSVYGHNPELPKRETQPTLPASPYAVTKLTGELYCKTFYELFRIETFALRYFNVFGPRQVLNSPYAAVIPRFIDAMKNGKPPVIFGDGSQSRDFTYIDNVVEANLKAMKATSGFGEAFNVACGYRTNLLQLIEYLNDITGIAIKPVFKEPRAGDVLHSLADITKAKSLLHFIPVTDMMTGLKQTVDWYYKNSGNK
jgi:nucleoside-diphosphate-sugar epimerase